jgi:hypothetical protein
MLDPWHISYQDRSKTTNFKTEGLHYIGYRSERTAFHTDAKGLTFNQPQHHRPKTPKKSPYTP